MSENPSYNCPNCETENPSSAKFCNNCGQKNKPLRVKIWEFIGEFFDSVFNLNNRFYKTFAHILIPGKLTKAFFRGHKVRYYHPLRLYIFSIIILLSVLSIWGVEDIISVSSLSDIGNFEKRSLVKDQGSALVSTLEEIVAESTGEYDSAIVDSFYTRAYLEIEDETYFLKDSLNFDTINMELFFTSITLTTEEWLIKDIETVMEDKNIDHWLDNMILSQLLKGARDFGSFNKFLFANLTWLLIALIPFFALILKLFYLRRKRYYLEHYVFLLHLFSALIFLASILFMFAQLPDAIPFVSGIGVLLSIVFPYIAFKRYYQQSFVKTFIKYLAIGFFFFVVFILCFAIFLLVSGVLF